jgi:hypothetical protein
MKHYGFIDSKGLDTLKQNSIYVGLERTQVNVPRTTGKIINPMRAGKQKANTQIQLVHGLLLDQAEGQHIGRVFHDLHAFRQLFGKDLLKRLKKVKM